MSVRGVYRILRLPLFITAVADVVAGYAVAFLPNIERFDWRLAALLAGTSAGLYLFGMVQNDLVDLRRDRLMKVPRPLVTGELSVAAAMVLLVLTFLLAAVCAGLVGRGAMVLAIATFVTINLYNLGAKRGPSFIAMAVMGLCRLLNFSIGVVAAVGIPRALSLDLLLPTGPLWVRHAVALFFAVWLVTGYSICARHNLKVSTRPWKAAFVAAAVAGFAMIALSQTVSFGHLTPPVARVFAVLLLAALWPGGLWSATGPQRRAEQYGAFVERALYWLIVMDGAFVLDGLLMR